MLKGDVHMKYFDYSFLKHGMLPAGLVSVVGAQGDGVECYTYNSGNVTPDSDLARIDSLIEYNIVPRYAVRPDQCDAQTKETAASDGKRYFKNDPYIHDDSANCRFVLGKYNDNPMFCFGINPSKATDISSDTTIAKVLGIAQRNGYDGYIMLNIYPLRSTELNALPDDYEESFHERNKQAIAETLPDGAVCVAAWGVAIITKPYFISLLRKIGEITKAKGIKWQCLGRTKDGHPRHPSRLPYDKAVCEDFDLDGYLLRIKGV
jgi:hypothetical protein